METSPGHNLRVLGFLAVVVGVAVLLVADRSPDVWFFVVGGLLIIGGLPLRIEGAIRDR